ncbi:hypothetical protein GWI33_020759 [Rhynchophorus ferrugineus]|uniref:Peptidase S1 domain-containing protein n=1 Tax=Rhynchophorus ferrugineus TaxID=354439 RepID=A0A834HVL6_RHYFE|nr:hypothetical protein GWI33_020759 [Rhynchophorus ferrugineus]
MKLLWVLTILFAITVLPKGTLAVANGTVDEPHSRPWIAMVSASISLLEYQYCAGILISLNYILTVASCFHTDSKYVQIHSLGTYLGVYNWDTLEGFVQMSGTIPINKVYQHENFNATTFENDIAIIELDIPARPIKGLVEIANLATEEDVQLGQVGRVSGWYYPIRESNQGLSHGGEVTVVDNSVCQETYPSYAISENVICASGYVAFCNGDQGTGLLINDKVVGMGVGPKSVLVPTEQCPIIPNTYLYIPKYLDWIKAHSDLE